MQFINYSLQVGNKLLIQDLNISFKKGIVNHLLGSNGCGKSSFAKTCVGMLRYKGTIKDNKGAVLLGSSSNIPSAFRVTDVVQILSQQFGKESVESLFNLLKLKDLSNNIPIRKMSDGQKQKIKLLAFLSASPKIIILDEFTTALDKSSTLDLYDFIKKYTKNNDITAINITHNLSDIEYLPGEYFYFTNNSIMQIPSKEKIIDIYVKGGISNGI